MLALTRKTDYALVALAHLAKQGSERVSAREIATKFRLPVPVLMNILNQLAHGGLVTSARGSKGGYRLARRPEQITLADLIDVVEGPVRLALCCSSEPAVEERECDLTDVCPVIHTIQNLHASLRRFLDQVTLEQIVSDDTPSRINVRVGVR